MSRYLLLLTICLAIASCGTKTSSVPEGNIGVESDIYLVPIGDVDEKYLPALIPKLERRFTTSVYLALDKRIPIPDYTYDTEKEQYAAMYILTEMTKKIKVPEDAKILGVCNVDLFQPESDLPFIFGQAVRGGNTALISMLRMNPRSYLGGRPNDELLIGRMSKEAVHELAHIFGLDNVLDPECVMFLPTDLKELDRKTDNFCLPSQKEFREIMQKKMKNKKE